LDGVEAVFQLESLHFKQDENHFNLVFLDCPIQDGQGTKLRLFCPEFTDGCGRSCGHYSGNARHEIFPRQLSGLLFTVKSKK
jgi:hypothetical protein